MATKPQLKHREHFLQFWEEEKEFFSSEGSYVTQHYVESGGQIQGTAMEGTQMQVKSYPNSFGDFRKAGWSSSKRWILYITLKKWLTWLWHF